MVQSVLSTHEVEQGTDEISESGNPLPTPSTSFEPLEIFEESDDSNPMHINYDFTKSEPLSIITDEDIVNKRPRSRRSGKRHYKVKK